MMFTRATPGCTAPGYGTAPKLSTNMLLGTDYPYDIGEENPVKLIDSVPRLTRAEKGRIVGRNAARRLKIKQRWVWYPVVFVPFFSKRHR